MVHFLTDLKMPIECIRNGFGDGLQQSHLFGMTFEHVVRFIDREYGEEIRQKTIEGWKDTKFSYGVKFCFLNAFGVGRLVCKNKTLYGIWMIPKMMCLLLKQKKGHLTLLTK